MSVFLLFFFYLVMLRSVKNGQKSLQKKQTLLCMKTPQKDFSYLFCDFLLARCSRYFAF